MRRLISLLAVFSLCISVGCSSGRGRVRSGGLSASKAPASASTQVASESPFAKFAPPPVPPPL
ncbi:MAG: hypothetical protein NXI04_25860 [Planctomycetaceae bacterium]|nr:hypothetical protein [Planctomycetaceae bacterium]